MRCADPIGGSATWEIRKGKALSNRYLVDDPATSEELATAAKEVIIRSTNCKLSLVDMTLADLQAWVNIARGSGGSFPIPSVQLGCLAHKALTVLMRRDQTTNRISLERYLLEPGEVRLAIEGQYREPVLRIVSSPF